MRFCRSLTVALTTLLVATSCGSDEPSDPVNDPAEAADLALDEAASEPNPDVTGDGAPPTTSSSTTTTTTTTVPGIQVDETLLRVNECFNQVDDIAAGRTRTITTRIECQHPHQFQVFHSLAYPAPTGTDYPGAGAVSDFGLSSCYLEFEAWTGSVYETSELEIRVFIPSQDDFENVGYRQIICYLERTDREPMVGGAFGQGW